MKIEIETDQRQIAIETDYSHSDPEKRREVYNKMYEDCMRYIFEGKMDPTDGKKK